jgi:hypothetical protein
MDEQMTLSVGTPVEPEHPVSVENTDDGCITISFASPFLLSTLPFVSPSSASSLRSSSDPS